MNIQITLENLRRIFFSSKFRIFLSLFFVIIISISTFVIAGYISAGNSISYLPQNIRAQTTSVNSKARVFKFKNTWYSLTVDDKGDVAIEDPKGKIILSSLYYYAEFEGEKNNIKLENVIINTLNDSCVEIKGNGSNNVQVQLSLFAYNSLPKIDVNIKTLYNVTTIVKREALIASFGIPVSEVYLKNRKIDKANFDSEYWLQKEGVRFGNNQTSAMIYHTPQISSLQLETAKRLLFINLDFALDHPLVKIPHQKNGAGKWIDISESEYIKGDERNNSFSINIGSFPKEIPRLMLVPYGFKAGYVFTEHADGGNIRKQRAAYFGSEDIIKADEAKGGFVGHRIPVTKSVFYTGPSGIPGTAIFEDGKTSPLLNFLDELHKTGLYDLCLHTPENISSNKQILNESIKFMKERYNAISWIDHGFYNGQSNRESLVCDGLDSASQFFAANIWEKYNTKFFWSAAVEIIKNSKWVSVRDNIKKFKFYRAYVTFLQHYLSPKELRDLNIFQAANEIRKRYSSGLELNTLEYNLGNAQPTPLYWQNPTISKQFYSWATNYEKYYTDLSDKGIKNEIQQLEDLIENQGVFINHGYFVRNHIPLDNVLVRINGKLVINPYFDKILSIMSEMRDKGDLCITTINDLLNYWIKLDKVSFEYEPDGTICVINNNNQPIKGLSLIMEAKNVSINGIEVHSKFLRDEIIFWFNIGPGEKIRINYN